MRVIGQPPPATRQLGKRGGSGIFSGANDRQDRPCGAVMGAEAAQRRSVVLPILLVIVLAVAAVGLGPTIGQLCSDLENVPSGP